MMKTENLDETTRLNLQCLQEMQEPANFLGSYVEDLILVLGLPAGTKKTILLLLSKMDNSGVILITSPIRKGIARNSGILVSTLGNHLLALTKANVLTRLSRGKYKLNKVFFSNIEKVDDKNRWSMVVVYDSMGGKQIEGHILP